MRRWQERFAQERLAGVLRDKTRPSRIPPLGPEVAERVVALTLTAPTREATHWTAAMMAGEVGISVSSVQPIWRAHGLQPHRVRQFTLLNDPDFVEKPRDVVGLVAEQNTDPEPFIWTADRNRIIAAVKRGHQASDSIHSL